MGAAAGTRALVLWDIDHTLIENDGVSKATYALAAELLIGPPTAVPPVTEGRTDAAIMAELMSGNGCNPDRFPLRRIWEVLTEAGCRNEAGLRARGQALPGAAEMREEIADYERWHGKRFVASKRHTIEVDFYPYMREIQRERKRAARAA